MKSDVMNLLKGGQSVLEESNEVLNDFFEIYLKDKIYESGKHELTAVDSKFYVTQLHACRRKIRISTPESKENTMKANPVLMGIMLEEAMSYYLKRNGYDTQIRYERNVGDFTISGRIDFYNEEKRIGAELKCPIYVKTTTEKLDNYINQCRGYLWLSENSLYPLKRVHLLQVSSTGRKEYTIKNPWTTDEVIDLIKNERYPYYNWECDYCDFEKGCTVKQ